jgi:hypothetical protein
MSEDSTVVSRAARLRTAFTVLGSAYLAYHGLAAGWLVFEFFVNTRPGYWRESGVLAELALTILIYPLAIPALVMCGGLHNCGGSPLTILAVPVLFLTLVAAGSATWLAFCLLRLRSRA